MSTLTNDEVLKVAHLARLAVDEQAAEKYAHDLSTILSLAAQMDKADTQNVAPMAHPLDVKQRLRADTITEKDQRELFQHLAPAVEAGLYLVPQVIE